VLRSLVKQEIYTLVELGLSLEHDSIAIESCISYSYIRENVPENWLVQGSPHSFSNQYPTTRVTDGPSGVPSVISRNLYN